MREIKLRQAKKRESTENARDSCKMRETWQGCSNVVVLLR